MKAKKIVDLTHYWGSKEMVVARYEGGQKVWVPKKFGRDRNEWGALDKRDYRVEIKDWLYSDGALTPDITIFSHAGTHLEAPGYHVINAPEHLKQKGIDVADDIELHKPYIDNVQLKCTCGHHMIRTHEVIDCWFDSGSMPFAQHHYPFENKEIFEANFPGQFISLAQHLLFRNPRGQSRKICGILV